MSEKKLKKPTFLSEKGKGFYDILLNLLIDHETFREADTLSLAVLANAFASYRDALRELDEHGTYYRTGDMRRLSPAYTVRKESEKTIRELSDRFGLSPKARDKFMKFDLRDEPDALDFI